MTNIAGRITKKIKIGSVEIGAGNPIAVQSMTNRKTEDIEATVEQIKELENAGCEIVRIAIPNKDAVAAIGPIKDRIAIPLVADIHFRWEYAVAAIEAGADKIRINPGNIGDSENVARIVDKAKEYDVAVRIGVNSGSLHPKYEDEEDAATALVKSCMEYVGFFENMGFYNLVLSVKSSSVVNSIKA
jgi:(E)-4-hydroxy-3-methylbut-2-enyl-diphosphate synthase